MHIYKPLFCRHSYVVFFKISVIHRSAKNTAKTFITYDIIGYRVYNKCFLNFEQKHGSVITLAEKKALYEESVELSINRI